MSKILMFVLIAVAFVSQSQACYFEDVDKEFCPNSRVVKGRNGDKFMVCGNRATRDILNGKANRAQPVSNKKFYEETRNNYLSAVDITIWPDDSTDVIYSYAYRLFVEGQRVGYITIEGYVNSEMESKVQVTTKYNNRGEVAAVFCQ